MWLQYLISYCVINDYNNNESAINNGNAKKEIICF